jgi:protein-S-isoprenylcysteine O-methyltransferase Ste14
MAFELMLRLLVLLLLGVTFLISGLYRRRTKTREFVKAQEDGWLGLHLRLAALAPLVLVVLLDIFAPPWIEWSKLNLPNWLRIIGLTLALVSVVWLWWVFYTLGNNISDTLSTTESQELITTGPYSWIRHPLYAGGLLCLFAFGLAFEDWVILVYALAGFLIFRFRVIPTEEEHLVATFGEDYVSYQRRTGSILPWIR